MNLDLTDIQKAWQDTVIEFARDHVAPKAAAIGEDDEFPRALIGEAAKLGLMGVTIPKDQGGAGMDYVSYALAMEALARASAVVAVILSVNN